MPGPNAEIHIESSRQLRPLRQLLTLLVGAVIASAVLVSTANTDKSASLRTYQTGYIAAADTDSVAIQIDSLSVLKDRIDSLLFAGANLDSLSSEGNRLDSLLADLRKQAAVAAADTLDTLLIKRYFTAFRGDTRSSRIFPREGRAFAPTFGRYWSHRIEFDTTALTYTSIEFVGVKQIRFPVTLNYEEYRNARLKKDISDTWSEILVSRSRTAAFDRRGGLGFEFTVPGGRQSAFTSIFGKPSFDLRVNGQADILAGFDYRESDQQIAITGRSSQLDPNFKQDLRLGITGTIGDKLKVDVQYDSQNQFDYENQLSLHYTGYEDEIIQSIEAGNVFLPTKGALIRGGQSLFGLKSEFQVGALNFIAIASQQEGQSSSLNIEGGSEPNPFDLRPTDYTDMTGFYLSYYFRNRWEDAHEDPPNIRVEPVFERITEIEVWRLQPTRPEELNVRQVVAMIDLGEESDELVGPDADPPGYTNTVLPDNSNDSYDEESGEIDQFLRNGDASPGSWLEENKNLTSSDYQIGKFKRLDQGQDYTLDPVLGYITLNSRLQESEALAVAYRYRTNGTTVQIGDFSTETGGSDGGQSETKLVLKLLRPVQLRQPARDGSFNPAAWYLEMRNLYSLSTGGVQPADFELQIYYEPPGQTSTKTLPGLNSSKTLLQLLNWDRVNADGALLPDDVFDFLVDYTIRPARGNLIFPVLEPFGTHMEKLIAESDLPEETREQLRRLYVFTALYREKKANARKDSQHDVFRIQGVSKGSVKAYYDLRAFAGIVPGSVRVTSGGTPLRETVDYVVDYSGGTLTITNSAYLISGRQIQIDYEQNSLFNVRKKTLLGLRADYTPSQNFQFGATVMTMKEKSPSDKFRIGDEPISNMIWGADASLNFEPRWLTSGIDMIPLLQTREPSRINVSGEFAQLRPNHVETQAFKRTEDRLADLGRSFSTDEQNGTSFIDDFEGFENVFSLMQPGSWNLASAPDSIGAIDRNGILPGVLGDSLRTNWRSGFAWYRINASTLQELPIIVYNDDPEPIQILEITDVYPTRDVQGQFGSTLETLDLYMNPFERGQYNYTGDLRGFLDNPKDTWGGMIHRLPEGFTDFSIKNIDFVEFVIRLFPENPARDAGRSAHLYIDLGRISEDVIPDEKLNNEDGLSMFEISESSIGKWARLPNSTQNSVIDIEDNTKRTEDLGLDGLASYGGDYPPYATEAVHFKAFLDSFDLSDPDPVYRAEVAKAMADPSGDDFQYYGNERYFGNTEFFPRPPYLQERFSKYFPSYELNGFETQSELAENTTSPRGNSRYPDSEDQNTNSTIDIDNSYFQYELTLSSIALDSLARPEETNDYVVGEITDENGVGNGWYQIRIPVKDFTRKVGSIQDFSQIESIRVWTAGHDVPITMRFASLELVGSQWQESERVLIESDGAGGPDEDESNRLTISSINNEENADVYIPPIGTIIGETRLPTGVIQESREQSLLLRKKMLLPGRQRGIFRTQNTALDLLKYSNLRMFVHMHGRTLDGRSLESLPKDEGRSKASLFVRLGANENNDYYEYEQPLTPSSETSGDADDLWQTNVDYEGMFQDLNSMNIELGAFNQLKVARDRLAFPTDSIFYNVVNGIPTAPDVPDAELFAPPGTRLGIKGNPSLGRINSIVIGIRNASDSTSTDFGDILEEITVWLNELRVSGYDETNGWAAVGNADIKLADIGNIRASIRSQTDGFGSLSSSLDEREQNNIDDWSVTTDIRANKLIPDRYNWSIPLSVQYASNTSTPRFSPTRGDVRLDEILSQINDRDDLSEEEKQVAEEQAILAAQTHSTTRSFSGRVSKSNSGSGLLRTTIDGVALTYSSAATEARTPALQVNNSNRWNSTLSYQYRGQAYTVKPLWLLQKIPFLGPIGRLQLNYAPQSVQTSASLKRNFSNSRDRPVVSAADTSTVPLIVRFPNREKHTFTHTRNFGLRYNPFQFLNLSFDYNTGQSFNQAGVDTLTSVAIGDTLYPGYSIDEAIDAGLIDEDDRSDAYEVKSLTMIPATQVLAEAIKGSSEIRTEVNDQSFTASFRPRFTNINALNWIQIQDITYSAKFRWKNGAINRNIGAGIGNTVTLRAGATVRIQDLFKKFGFYRSIERRQNEFTARKATEAIERDRAKDARNRAKEQAKTLEAAAADAEPEDVEPEDAEPEDAEPADDEEEVDDEDESLAAALNAPGRTAPSEVTDTGGGIRLPSIRSWARQLVLAITGIRDFTLNYDGSRASASTNFGVPVYTMVDSMLIISDVSTYYSIFDSFKGNGASPAYRFGFQRQMGLEDRVLDPSLQVADILINSDKFQGKTTLNPSNVLSITLNWNLDYQSSETFSFRPLFDSDNMLIGLDTTITRSGGNSATIWAFGASYLDMFDAQLATFNSDLDAKNPNGPVDEQNVIGDEDRNGRVALTNASVTQDFQRAFVKAGRTIDAQNLLPFPRPNWSISYTGASSWPLIRSLVQNLTIRHSYNATYSSNYFTNTQFTGEDSTFKFIDLDEYKIQFEIEEIQVGAVRVNENYSPLIGLDIGWKKQFSTNMQWTRSNSYSLSTTNFEVSRARTNEFSFTASWQKSGLRLPFFGGKTLTNRVNFSLTVGKSFSDDQRLRLRRGLEEAVQNPDDFVSSDALAGDNISLITSYTRTTIIPKVGYQFSNKVTANFQLKYELFDSQDSRQPSSTVIQGNFNIRVSIAN